MSAVSPAAVLFDMDGTLVDTEQLWWEAVADVAGRVGYALGETDAADVVGHAIGHTASYLHEVVAEAPCVHELTDALDAAFTTRVEARIEPLPGVLALLDGLAAAGVPLAIVSASPRRVVDLVRDALGSARFAVTVAAEDVPRTKPDPAPYLAAATALGVEPSACVAVEDTMVGVTSAEAAGCAVLAVSSTVAMEPAPGRRVVESLASIEAGELAVSAAARA
ncbi:HAD family hydrolase [Embleya sp. NPDC020886]|uniref:HAD family hydrolase n=1 Tax=Embleya sp. NPDC020886 TaxID=3363980 RepID=UPI0037A27C3F